MSLLNLTKLVGNLLLGPKHLEWEYFKSSLQPPHNLEGSSTGVRILYTQESAICQGVFKQVVLIPHRHVVRSLPQGATSK